VDSSFAGMGKKLFFLENRIMKGRNEKDMIKDVIPARMGWSIGGEKA
jgi:hypothetical protein